MTIIQVTQENFSQRLDELRENLLKLKIERQDAIRGALSIEEIAGRMLQSSKDGKVEMMVYKLGGKVMVRLSSRGEKVSADEIRQNIFGLEDGEDDEYNEVIQHLVQRVMGTDISIAYSRGKNHCTIAVAHYRYASLFLTLNSLVLGIIFGLLVKNFLPAAGSSWISQNIMASGSTMFLNALKMIVGPLVFFSMASSIAGFTDMRSLGRVAAKTITGYMCTSLIAIGIGYLAYQIMPVGDPALMAAVSDAAESTIAKGANVTISVKDTIVNIVPSSFASPFVLNDMLQIIFMGSLLGIAVSAISEFYPGAKDALNCLNSIFSKITAIIISFMPIAVFCSMSKMIIGMDYATLLQVAAWIPVNYIGYIPMIGVYCLLLAVLGRVNPIHFLKGFSPAMFTAFSLASSNATMPTSMECCKKLGISKSVYSFTIPLGATINMDGSCIMLMISSLFMAKIFGVTISGGEIITLVVAIMALSVGAPGVPGGALVCLSLLLPQIGIPAEAISIIMGIYTLCSMGFIVVNVTGDAALSTIVARSENMLDMEQYNSN